MTETATLEHAAYEAAKRFLELIAIVDDGKLERLPEAKPDAKKPGSIRREAGVAAEEPSPEKVEAAGDSGSPVDYEEISKASMREGIFTALVRPDPLDEEGAKNVARSLAKADIIVLDWRIKGLDDGQYASWIINALRTQNPGRKQQVICIYSDFPTPDEALKKVADNLEIDANLVVNGKIQAGSLVIVWRSKTGVPGFPKTDSKDLPTDLIKEFAKRHAGLVPLLAMEALTAVRLNTLPILDRYSAGADVGFAYDCLLLGGADSVAPAIREALADDLAVSIEAESNTDALSLATCEAWSVTTLKRDSSLPASVKKATLELSQKHVAAMIVGGCPQDEYNAIKNKRSNLTKCFFENDNAEVLTQFAAIYSRFAALLSTQYWPEGAPARLTLGTILEGETEYCVCLQPSCDCIRIDANTKFPIIAINPPPEKPKNLLSMPIIDGDAKDLYLLPRMPDIQNVVFSPQADVRMVVAIENTFLATDNKKWRFVSRLRTSHAHRALHMLTTDAGRIGVSEGELGRLTADGR